MNANITAIKQLFCIPNSILEYQNQLSSENVLICNNLLKIEEHFGSYKKIFENYFKKTFKLVSSRDSLFCKER